MAGPYRDETEALRVRLKDLEVELADARATIERLQRAPAPNGLGQWLLGAPTVVDVEHVLDGEVPADAYEELLETINRRIGSEGHVAIVGRRFSYAIDEPQRGRYFDLTVQPQRGKTSIRLRVRLGRIAGGLFGGIVGGFGGSALAVAVTLAIASQLGPLSALASVAFTAFLWMTVRFAYQKLVAVRRRNMQGLAADVVRVCNAHLRGKDAGARSRGEARRGAETEAHAEDEAHAEVEARAEAEEAETSAAPMRARGTSR